MNAHERISSELREFFGNHPFFKILLPIDLVLVFVGAGFLILNSVLPRLGLSQGFFGGLFSSLAYWGFLLGLILAYANLHQKVLYIGCFMYGALNAFLFLKYIKSFSMSFLVPALIFGFLGYIIFKMTTTSGNTNVNS